tara:strand:+ start:106 stop:312 length:207 start_codon:yes stop_codon:yes gene_type:complete
MDKLTRRRIKKDKEMAQEILVCQRTLARHGFFHGKKPPEDSFLYPLWIRSLAAKRRVRRIKQSLTVET